MASKSYLSVQYKSSLWAPLLATFIITVSFFTFYGAANLQAINIYHRKSKVTDCHFSAAELEMPGFRSFFKLRLQIKIKI